MENRLLLDFSRRNSDSSVGGLIHGAFLPKDTEVTDKIEIIELDSLDPNLVDLTSFEVLVPEHSKPAPTPASYLENFCRVLHEETSETSEMEKSKLSLFRKGRPLFVAEFLSELEKDDFISNMNIQPFWLDVYGFNKRILKKLAFIFQFHPLTIDDILIEEKPEKYEVFANYIFTSIQMLVKREEGGTDPHTLYIICTQHFVITLHQEKLENLERIYQRIEGIKSVRVNSGWIFYMIIDRVVDAYIPFVEGLEMEVSTLDSLQFDGINESHDEMLLRIGRATKRASILQGLITQKIEILKLMIMHEKHHLSFLPKDVLLYMHDVEDHVTHLEQILANTSKQLNRIYSNYLTNISIDQLQNSDKMGILMKKFSCAICIFLPLNLTVTVGGMNVGVPGNIQGPRDEPYWFWIMVGCMAATALALFLIAKWKKIC